MFCSRFRTDKRKDIFIQHRINWWNSLATTTVLMVYITLKRNEKNLWRKRLSMVISHNDYMEPTYPEAVYLWILVTVEQTTSEGYCLHTLNVGFLVGQGVKGNLDYIHWIPMINYRITEVRHSLVWNEGIIPWWTNICSLHRANEL